MSEQALRQHATATSTLPIGDGSETDGKNPIIGVNDLAAHVSSGEVGILGPISHRQL